jgi:hypothetical protein
MDQAFDLNGVPVGKSHAWAFGIFGYCIEVHCMAVIPDCMIAIGFLRMI